MKSARSATDYMVKNGKCAAVILPIEEYKKLLRNLAELAVITVRKNGSTIPFAAVKRRMRASGK